MESLQELFEEQIKDLFSAENQLLKAMPKMIKKVTTDSLKKAIESHRIQTEGHVERLKKIAETLDFKVNGKVCHAMKGLLEEATEAMQEHDKGLILDAAIVADSQRIEHYEISAYGTIRALAEHLGHNAAVKLIELTLREEGLADQKLTQIVMNDVYPTAESGSEEDSEGSEMEEQEMDA